MSLSFINKITLIFSLFAFCSCGNNASDKEVLEKKDKSTDSSVGKENNKSTVNKAKNEVETSSIEETPMDWAGKWIYESGSDLYSVIIQPEKDGIIKCTVAAEGIQLFYDLDCRGRVSENTFEIYYVSTNDGIFFNEENITSEKPLLSFTSTKDKVVTNWGQLSDEKNGLVRFKKK